MNPLTLGQVATVGILLGLSIPALARAAWTVVNYWRPQAQDGRSLRRWFLALFTTSAVLRIIVLPLRMATIYTGYYNTSVAISLDRVTNYGAGTSIFYHTLFQVLPGDHLTIMRVNSVLGALTVPLIATWAADLFRDRRTGILAAGFVALLPVFLRNDTSDANNIPCLFWMFSGLVLWQEHLRTSSLTSLLAAIPLFCLAGAGRPEFSVLVASAAILTAWGGSRGWHRPRLALIWWGLAAAIWLGFLVPHAIHVIQATREMDMSGSLPGFSVEQLLNPQVWLWHVNLLATPGLFPVAIPLLGLVALALPGPAGLRAGFALLILTFVSLAAYMVDADLCNIPRIHVPAAIFACALGACGAMRFVDHSRRKWTLVPILGLVVGTAIPGALALFALTNEDHEEALLQEVRSQLPDHSVRLVTRLDDDMAPDAPSEARFTHLHQPEYWFRQPGGRSQLVSINSWMAAHPAAGERCAARPTDSRTPGHYRLSSSETGFFLLGTRCYAEFRSRGTQQPSGDNMHPACRRMLDCNELEPVFEWTVPNLGNRWIGYYGDAPTLRLGLYRIINSVGEEGPRQSGFYEANFRFRTGALARRLGEIDGPNLTKSVPPLAPMAEASTSSGVALEYSARTFP